MSQRLPWISSLALVGAAFAVSALFYPHLPDPVPTHFGANGVVNGWMPKPWGAIVTPLIMLPLLGLFVVIPRISPNGFRIEPFARVYGWIVLLVMATMVVIHAQALAAGMGAKIAIDRWVAVVIGVLFVLLGNLMPKVRRNFFVGIRTPWTLSDDEVWAKTHRLGGKTMVAGGIAAIVTGAAGLGQPWIPVGSVIVSALIPCVYSYFVWRAAKPA
jgi:uncharacterized membrane protein